MNCPAIDPPFDGEWKVVHNPGDTPHALDFVGMEPDRRLPYPPRAALANLVYRTAASAAFGWNRPLYAPIAGEVVDAKDGYADTAELNLIRDLVRNVAFPPDVTENVQRFAGNYVVIESAECVAFLAHLRRGSVAVEPGDSVEAGHRIGAVGNAGATLVPHLHLQTLREWPTDILRLAEVDRPFGFSRFERLRDGVWKPVENRRPDSGDRIRTTVDTPPEE